MVFCIIHAEYDLPFLPLVKEMGAEATKIRLKLVGIHVLVVVARTTRCFEDLRRPNPAFFAAGMNDDPAAALVASFHNHAVGEPRALPHMVLVAV